MNLFYYHYCLADWNKSHERHNLQPTAPPHEVRCEGQEPILFALIQTEQSCALKQVSIMELSTWILECSRAHTHTNTPTHPHAHTGLAIVFKRGRVPFLSLLSPCLRQEVAMETGLDWIQQERKKEIRCSAHLSAATPLCPSLKIPPFSTSRRISD